MTYVATKGAGPRTIAGNKAGRSLAHRDATGTGSRLNGGKGSAATTTLQGNRVRKAAGYLKGRGLDLRLRERVQMLEW